MSEPAPAAADRNLLFGVLALQLDFISRDQLIAAMNAWVLDKHKPLGQILQEQRALRADDREALELLVARHLERHGQEPQRSLAALSVGPQLRDELRSVADGELHTSLDTLPPLRNPPTPTEAHRPAAGGRQARDAAAAEPLSTGPRFRVLRPHAEGGLGQVSVARDRELNREVALKEIKPDYAEDDTARARFLAEAEITGGLEHPGIVPVYSLGRYEDGRPYYAMRLIQGHSLLEAITRFHQTNWTREKPGERALALRALLRRFVDVCNAVAYAHSRGVIHRDLKPANVLLGPYGETLLVDWGLAKPMPAEEGLTSPPEGFLQPASGEAGLTQVGAVLGTPAYMAPEQARGEAVGPAADVYGLGATLYHLLTGQAPYRGSQGQEILTQAAQGRCKPAREINASVSAALSALCQKAMAPRPADRYGSTGELAQEVERWLADEPVAAWQEPLGVRAGRWLRRNRTLVATALAALSVAVVGSLAVAAVATQSRQSLAVKNHELQEANVQIAQARDRAERRVDLALGAVDSFREAVDKHLELKDRPENEALRKALLQTPLAFYQKLRDDFRQSPETGPQDQAKLADAYFQLATLNRDIGSQADALSAYAEAVAMLESLAQDMPASQREGWRGRLAQAMAARGALQSESDSLTGSALASLGRALELFEVRLREDPGNVAVRVQMARVLDNRAKIEAAQGKIATALDTLTASRDLLEEARRREPANHEAALVLASTHRRTAGVLRDQKSQLPQALASAQKALEIAEPLAKGNPHDMDIQSRLADIRESLGDIHRARGDFNGALADYRRQQAVVDDMVRAHPTVLRYQVQLVYALTNVSRIEASQGQNTEAMATNLRARKLAETLVRDNPSSTAFQKALSSALNQSMFPLYALGRVAEALDCCEAQAAVHERMVRLNPGDVNLRRQLAGNYYNAALLNKNLGRVEAALAWSAKSLGLREQLAREHPDQPRLRWDVASTLGNQGIIQLNQHSYAEARDSFQRAVAILEELARASPESAEYETYLTRAQMNLGRALSNLHQSPQALEVLRGAQLRAERMARRQPGVVQYQEDLAYVGESLGNALRTAGKLAEAKAAFANAVAIREKLLETSADNLANREALVELLCSQASLEHVDLGQSADAVTHWRRALAVGQAVQKPSADLLYDLACCHACLATASTADSRAEIDRALKTLRRAIAAGFDDAEKVRTDPSLASLRERDDFQKLLAEMKKDKPKPK
jgi:serine/threonine-protein kinase